MITLTIIKGKYLDDNGNEHPLPNINLILQAGVVLGFDSVKEREQYIVSLPKQWDKPAYCDAVNAAHNSLFQQLYTERDYIDMSEIPLWFEDEEFDTESRALKAWWVNTCKLVSIYLQDVNENTALPVPDYIASLPNFE